MAGDATVLKSSTRFLQPSPTTPAQGATRSIAVVREPSAVYHSPEYCQRGVGGHSIEIQSRLRWSNRSSPSSRRMSAWGTPSQTA